MITGGSPSLVTELLGYGETGGRVGVAAHLNHSPANLSDNEMSNAGKYIVAREVCVANELQVNHNTVCNTKSPYLLYGSEKANETGLMF